MANFYDHVSQAALPDGRVIQCTTTQTIKASGNRWFAWRPVRLRSGGRAWLQFVRRWEVHHRGASAAVIEYLREDQFWSAAKEPP